MPDRQLDKSEQFMIVSSVCQDHERKFLGQYFQFFVVKIYALYCIQVYCVELGQYTLFFVEIEEVLSDLLGALRGEGLDEFE